MSVDTHVIQTRPLRDKGLSICVRDASVKPVAIMAICDARAITGFNHLKGVKSSRLITRPESMLFKCMTKYVETTKG